MPPGDTIDFNAIIWQELLNASLPFAPKNPDSGEQTNEFYANRILPGSAPVYPYDSTDLYWRAWMLIFLSQVMEAVLGCEILDEPITVDSTSGYGSIALGPG